MVTDIEMHMTQCLSYKHSPLSGEGRPWVGAARLGAGPGGTQPSVQVLSELSLRVEHEVASLERGSPCRGSRLSRGRELRQQPGLCSSWSVKVEAGSGERRGWKDGGDRWSGPGAQLFSTGGTQCGQIQVLGRCG